MNENQVKENEFVMSRREHEILIEHNVLLGALINGIDQAMTLSSFDGEPRLDGRLVLDVFRALFPVSYQSQVDRLKREVENDQDQG